MFFFETIFSKMAKIRHKKVTELGPIADMMKLKQNKNTRAKVATYIGKYKWSALLKIFNSQKYIKI